MMATFIFKLSKYGAIISFGIVIGLYLKSKHKIKKPLMKVLFFPDVQPSCLVHFISESKCTKPLCSFSHDENNSYAQLVRMLVETKKSFDLCIFLITSNSLADVIISLHRNDVIVRIITDDEQINATNSQIGRLKMAGIQVRDDASTFLMHHKFVIIDKTFLINGSFNWTQTAISGNNENVTITDDPQLLFYYQKEFDKLWQHFDPRKRKT